MRTLSATATALAESDSRIPFVQLDLRPRLDRSSNHFTFARHQIKAIQISEGRWGGNLSSPGSPHQIAAVVALDNSARNITETFVGYRGNFAWGYIDPDTDQTYVEITSLPYYVAAQRYVSREGVSIIELDFMDIWGLFDLSTSIWQTSGSYVVGWNPADPLRNESVRQILHEVFSDGPFDKVWKNGGNQQAEWFDITHAAALRDAAGNELDFAVGTIELYNPDIANDAGNVSIYFGSATPFNTVSIDFHTVEDAPGSSMVLFYL